jgi:hypothetical protein
VSQSRPHGPARQDSIRRSPRWAAQLRLPLICKADNFESLTPRRLALEPRNSAPRDAGRRSGDPLCTAMHLTLSRTATTLAFDAQ